MKKLWKRNQIMITALALMIAIAGYLNFMGKQVKEEELFTTSAQFEDSEVAGVYDVAEENQAGLTDIDSMDSESEAVQSDYLDEESAEADFSTDSAEVMSTDVENQTAGAVDSANETAEAVDSANETAEAVDSANETADVAMSETTEAGISETADAGMNETEGEVPGEAVFTSTTGITSLASANLLKEQTREKSKETLLEIINNTALSDAAKQDAVDSMIALTDISQKECAAEILLQAKGFENVVVSISNNTADVMVGLSELTDAQRAQIEDIVKRKTGISAENIIISPVGEN